MTSGGAGAADNHPGAGQGAILLTLATLLPRLASPTSTPVAKPVSGGERKSRNTDNTKGQIDGQKGSAHTGDGQKGSAHTGDGQKGSTHTGDGRAVARGGDRQDTL